MPSLRRLLSVSIALLALTAPARVTASPPFPEAIRADLSLTYSLGTSACLTSSTPDCHCTICHLTSSGGIGTVLQPFGIAMKQAGLHLEDTISLQHALDTLEMNKTDSDCNMLPDIEQLKAGRDPNPPGEYIDGSGRTAPPDPGCGDAGLVAFGCGAQLAPAPSSWPRAAGLVAALGLVLASRRRRPR